jgi:hypothetical protein
MPVKGQFDPAFDGMSSSPDPADLNAPGVKSRIGPKDQVSIGLSGKADGTTDGDLGIPNGDADWIASGFQRAYYSGIIKYHDAFKGTPEHVTKFCFVIKASRVSKDAEAVPYNAGLCPHWNCADEECDSDRADFYRELGAAYEREKTPVPPALLKQIQETENGSKAVK